MTTRAEYQKQWRIKNPEKAKEIQKRSYHKNHEKLLAYKRNRPKAATRAIARNYYHRNAERIKAQRRVDGKKQRNKERLDTFIHYSEDPPHCMCQGEDCWHTGPCIVTDIRGLGLDHTNNDGAKERKRIGYGGWRFYVWLRLHNYPKGYEVWCILCNTIKAQKLIRV